MPEGDCCQPHCLFQHVEPPNADQTSLGREGGCRRLAPSSRQPLTRDAPAEPAPCPAVPAAPQRQPPTPHPFRRPLACTMTGVLPVSCGRVRGRRGGFS